MLSVHPRSYRLDDPDINKKYSSGWEMPGSAFAKDRLHSSQREQLDTLNPKIVAAFLGEFVCSPIIFDKAYRKEANFICSIWFALDFDDGKYTLEHAIEDFKDHAHVIGTTKSHQIEKGSKPACDRFRVFVLGDKICDSLRTYRYNMQLLVDTFGADDKCVDGARYFAPCKKIVSIGSEHGERLVWSVPPADFKLANDPKIPRVTRESMKTALPKSAQSDKYFTRTTDHFLEFGAYAEGCRSDVVYSVCCDLLRKGKSELEVFDIVSSRTSLPTNEIKSCLQSAKGTTGL